MKKQKICIIGGGLTGLITALKLSKLNVSIDLIVSNIDQSLKSSRTTAISQENFDFLNKLNIFKSKKKEFWPCTKMQLYSENKNEKFLKIFELNNENKKKKILYMMENSKIMKFAKNEIKNTKSISVKDYKDISEINVSGFMQSVKYGNNTSKYNLVIICTGHKSALIKNIFNEKIIENSYKELAITAILSHHSCKNNIARQIFLEDEILALLPISNTKTSIVWSVKKDMRKKNNLFLKRRIAFYTKNYLKNVKFETCIEFKELNFLIRRKYHLDRTLLFGDAIHTIHPFVGQGFNMTLRDLASLEKVLTQKINLGLDIGSSDTLSEFSNEVKPRNFAFSIGTDFLKNSFSYKKLRNEMLKILNKSNFAKDICFNIANKGFRF